MGKIIFTQALVKLVQAVSQLSLNMWVSRRLGLILHRRESKKEIPSIEKRVPSIKQSSISGCDKVTKVRSFSDNQTSPVKCSICMNDRKHPAALSGCGHIFCWSCIQHWTSTVKYKCPICRCSLKFQDVIPLYNYIPS